MQLRKKVLRGCGESGRRGSSRIRSKVHIHGDLRYSIAVYPKVLCTRELTRDGATRLRRPVAGRMRVDHRRWVECHVGVLDVLDRCTVRRVPSTSEAILSYVCVWA